MRNRASTTRWRWLRSSRPSSCACTSCRARIITFRIYRRRIIDENRWRASRYGLEGKLIDFGREAEVETRSLVAGASRICRRRSRRARDPPRNRARRADPARRERVRIDSSKSGRGRAICAQWSIRSCAKPTRAWRSRRRSPHRWPEFGPVSASRFACQWRNMRSAEARATIARSRRIASRAISTQC